MRRQRLDFGIESRRSGDLGLAALRMTVAGYVHAWRFGLCHVLAMTAALAPLLVLLALKQGVVSGELEQIARSPQNLEIRHVGQGAFDPAWFEAMAARDDVAFVVPRTRFLAATLVAQHPTDFTVPAVELELIPTAAGDPLLEGYALPAPRLADTPGEPWDIVLSASAAQTLRATVGGTLQGIIGRTRDGTAETVVLALSVADILPANRAERDIAFVTLDFLEAAEAYRETTYAVDAFGTEGRPWPEERTYASFRLYARDVHSVPDLRTFFVAQHLDVSTQAARVEEILRLQRNLGMVFVIVATLAIGGATLSVGVSILSNTMRQRRELCVLRLIGFPRMLIAALPLGQAVISGGLAVLISLIIYAVASRILNDRFAGMLAGDGNIMLITPADLTVAGGVTIMVAFLSAGAASGWAMMVKVDHGLRDE